MTPNSWSKLERYLVWLVALLGLLKLTTYVTVEQEEATSGLTSYRSAQGAIPEMDMPGIGVGSPSSKNSPTSGSISRFLAGSSTEIASSMGKNE